MDEMAQPNANDIFIEPLFTFHFAALAYQYLDMGFCNLP